MGAFTLVFSHRTSLSHFQIFNSLPYIQSETSWVFILCNGVMQVSFASELSDKLEGQRALTIQLLEVLPSLRDLHLPSQ